MPSPKLLWIADETHVQAESDWNGPESGFAISRVTSLAHAAQVLRAEEFDCVLATGCLPDCNRLDILEAVHGVNASARVVFSDPRLTAFEAAQLVRNGASQVLGFRDSPNDLLKCVREACEESRRERKQKPVRGPAPWEQSLVGESRAMQDVMNTVRIIGPRRCTVLITGETGTGKEMAARALHAASPRGRLPLVAVNCCALPDNLLEAELFGHVKGAFTGAANHRTGRFEQADKSTIFLDEIGEMPLELQAKLLRVLQERELQRLGSSETIRVDVRVIAASNADLQERIRQGRFRDDLYYRLNVVPLRMPPLRERRSDVPLLIDHFVAKICGYEDLPVKRVTPEAKERLSRLSWPGNVRQLENLVEMAIAMCGDRDTLSSADFGLFPANLQKTPVETPPDPSAVLPMPIRFETAVSDYERSILNMALAQTGGNKTAAAELLGMKRTTLIMKLRGMRPKETELELVS
ncbi:MAG: sigma-54 dependent transcriptional regulator [Bryobacteraceae bacterium]|jgi:DNA-binding NtrC family response regulator